MERHGMSRMPEGIPKFYRFDMNNPLKYRDYRHKNKREEKITEFNILAIEQLGKDLHTRFNVSHSNVILMSKKTGQLRLTMLANRILRKNMSAGHSPVYHEPHFRS